MSEFKRWISYIYAYNGEIKGKNVGFAKIEARDGKCRLNISIKGAYGCDTRGLDVGLFVRRSGRPVRFSAGRMRICAGAGEFGETTRRDNLFESGYALADCGGLWITGPGKDTLYLTSWEKDCLDIRDFLGDEAAARRQEEPPVYQKEMQSPEKEDKKAQEMQAPQESREPVQTVYVTAAAMEAARSLAASPQFSEAAATAVQPQLRIIDVIRQPAGRSISVERAAAMEQASRQPAAGRPAVGGQPSAAEGQLAVGGRPAEPAGERKAAEREPAEQAAGSSRAAQKQELDQLPQPGLWESLCRYYPKTAPELRREGIELLQIRPADLRYLPRRLWHFGSNSFLLHGYYHYRHLVLGRTVQEGRPEYILGVRGTRDNRESFSAGLFGFGNFLPADEDGYEGYWYTRITLDGEK